MFTVVIGGGAAGMVAAYEAAANGNRVLLLEKNEKLGKKIYITGKGRGNVTNACDFDVFISNVVRNPRFMYSSLKGFDQTAVMDLMESFGTRVKIERGQRVFPVSDHASDITKALTKAMESVGVEIRLNTNVKEILPGFTVKTNKGSFKCDSVIVATGGLSYPSTGSTGDGYRFASDFGLEVLPQSPSLVSVHCEGDFNALAGVSLKNIGLRVTRKDNGKKVNEGQGELLFTHKGLSGPLILSASAILSGMIDKNNKYIFSIDLKPGMSEEELDKRILSEFEEKKNADLGNVMASMLINGIRQEVIERSGLSTSKKARDITRAERERLVKNIKSLEFTAFESGGFEEAVVTKGGVSVKELNPKTMESKKVPGLYFAGEVVDVDAMTGGFNLQCAFSMGVAAGRNQAKEEF
ncbi:MAG: NAD(P)/FAD-dependent oxidoreductase [Eubacteriales bacterium]|nr:NAD(P)/FAD-dependent oxidoreductase [Eubacteriales bacterium]